MASDPSFWQARYRQQVSWTATTRRYIFQQAKVQESDRILEVGSGSGALLESLTSDGYQNTFGVDLDFQTLTLERPAAHLTLADGRALPFPMQTFDHCLCHFLLLWLKSPESALEEMRRVTKKGGWVIALAEPDYGGRIDYPPELAALGDCQIRSLQAQGADPLVGRKLLGFFRQLGLINVQSGIISAEWPLSGREEDAALEWEVLERDLEEMVGRDQMARFRELDRSARAEGGRILFVPIFYTYGQVN